MPRGPPVPSSNPKECRLLRCPEKAPQDHMEPVLCPVKARNAHGFPGALPPLSLRTRCKNGAFGDPCLQRAIPLSGRRLPRPALFLPVALLALARLQIRVKSFNNRQCFVTYISCRMDLYKGRQGGLSQRPNSKFTKCHYHAPDLEPLVPCRHRRRISLAPMPFWGCTVIKQKIGAVQWNSEQIVGSL